jgi:ABC-type transport system involved in multi-copper enzyme maturation permease subunit
MIWLTWRQHRTTILVTALLLVGMVAFLAIVGGQMHQGAQLLHSSTCERPEGCPDIDNAWGDAIGQFHTVTMSLLAVPALFGVFVGAPLVAREYEQQTYKTAWTQSITRSRWFVMQVALLFVGVLAVSGILSALVYWADSATQDQRYTTWAFDLSALAPASYSAFALALGIAAGTLFRRTLPAIAVALAGYLAVRIPITSLLRVHYLPPLTEIEDLGSLQLQRSAGFNGNTDWFLEQGYMQGGHKYPNGIVPQTSYCPADQITLLQQQQWDACMKAHGWSQYTIYQPADRFWLFQGIESAIFFGLAAALLALTIWWVRRRLV